MPKHPPQKHSKSSEAIAKIGEPSQLLKKFSLSKEDENYCLEQLTSEGPEHKQAYAAVLLQRAAHLVSAVEKYSGQTFAPQKGYEMEFGKHEAVAVPIALPSSALKKESVDDVKEVLSKSPEHEGILFNLLLQAIEWSAKNSGKKEAEN